LIASWQSVDSIREYVQADSLAYLSLEGLKTAVSDTRDTYCYACYTGDYPTDLVGIEQLLADHRGKG
jgi:amidophosphoribosyltransferase